MTLAAPSLERTRPVSTDEPRMPKQRRTLETSEQHRRRTQLLAVTAFPAIVGLALAPAALGRSGVLGLFAIVAVVAVYLIASSPVRVGLVLVALVPITAGLARGIAVPGLRISEVLIVIGALSVWALPTSLQRRWSRLDSLVLIYVGLGALLPLANLIVGGRPLDSVAVQTVMGPVQFGILYFVVSTCFRTDRDAVRAQRWLLLASLPVSALGVAESLGPPAVHEFLLRLTRTTAFNTEGYTSVLRAASVFPVWLSFAGYLLVVLVLTTSLLLVKDRAVLPRWALLLVLVSGLMALAATLTFTVAIVYVLAALFLGWRHGRFFSILLAAGVALTVVQLAFGSLISQRAQAQTVPGSVATTAPSWLPETLVYRLDVWRGQYLESLTTFAATGYGPGFPPGVDWSHTESGYITLLLRGGVPYLAAAIVLLVGIVRRGRREAEAARTPARLALCETAVVVALAQVPLNVTFPYFTATGLPQSAWIMWGLLAGQLVKRPHRGMPGFSAGARGSE